MIRGVVFDLWNTIAYNTAPRNPIVALGRLFGLAGRPGWVATIERAIMLAPLAGIEEGLTQLEKATGRVLDAAEREDAIGAWRAAVPTATLFPDSLPVLDRLRERGPGAIGNSPDANRASRERLSPAGSDSGIRLGLLSNTQSFDLEFVRVSGLAERFDAVRYSWETGLLKPDPCAFHAAAGALGLSPSEVLMVGDNLRDDVRGARAAGLSALLIRRPGGALSHREPPADEPFITTLDELGSVL